MTYTQLITHMQGCTTVPAHVLSLMALPVYQIARVHSNAAVVHAALSFAQALVLSHARVQYPNDNDNDAKRTIGVHAVSTIVTEMRALWARSQVKPKLSKSSDSLIVSKHVQTLLAFNTQVLSIIPHTHVPSSLLVSTPSTSSSPSILPAPSSSSSSSIPQHIPGDVAIKGQLVVQCLIALYSPITASLVKVKQQSTIKEADLVGRSSGEHAPHPHLQLLFLELMYSYHSLVATWLTTTNVDALPSQLQVLLAILEEQCRQCSSNIRLPSGSDSSPSSSGNTVYHSSTSEANVIQTLSLIFRWLELVLQSCHLSSMMATHMMRLTASIHLLACYDNADIRLLAARFAVHWLRFLSHQHESSPSPSSPSSIKASSYIGATSIGLSSIPVQSV
jgi:hypothetical protein